MQELVVNPLFKGALKEIFDGNCPVVPAFVPGHSQEETYSILERIKYESGRKEGFVLFHRLLNGDR